MLHLHSSKPNGPFCQSIKEQIIRPFWKILLHQNQSNLIPQHGQIPLILLYVINIFISKTITGWPRKAIRSYINMMVKPAPTLVPFQRTARCFAPINWRFFDKYSSKIAITHKTTPPFCKSPVDHLQIPPMRSKAQNCAKADHALEIHHIKCFSPHAIYQSITPSSFRWATICFSARP